LWTKTETRGASLVQKKCAASANDCPCRASRWGSKGGNISTNVGQLHGGSYLDLIPLFDVSKSHLYKLFGRFLNWVLKTFEFPLARWIREDRWQPLIDRALDFAEKTNGIFYGAFAANDGLVVRIWCPRLDEVPDPGNYYCRKGFYALNVQAMCDRRKYFLWCYPSNKGSTHDSAAFMSSRLYNLLKEKSTEFCDRGLFIVGDSAYGLTPFLLTPYDQDEIKNDVDGAKD
jgi:DDE superfamily endonuclease